MATKQNPAITPLKLTAAIVFAALVCVVTISFTVSVPVTSGYFNLGEALIYVAALTFGPVVGALGKKLTTKTSRSNWRIYTALLGITVGVLLAATGAVYYSGNVDLYVG